VRHHLAINIDTRVTDSRVAFETCLDRSSKFRSIIDKMITKPDINADIVIMYTNLANISSLISANMAITDSLFMD